MEYIGTLRPYGMKTTFLVTEGAMGELEKAAAKHKMCLGSLEKEQLKQLLEESGLKAEPLRKGAARIYTPHDEVVETQANLRTVFDLDDALTHGFHMEGPRYDQPLTLTTEDLGVLLGADYQHPKATETRTSSRKK